MTVEGQHPRRAADRAGPGHGPAQNALVAEVHAVEETGGQDHRPSFRTQGRQGGDELHRFR